MSSQFQNWKSSPEETRGPLMAITLWSLGGISLLFLVIRCCIRQKQKKFWYDDGVLVVSWLLLLVQILLNQLSINLGLGKHALDINFDNFERITYYGASGLTISIGAIVLSKISFGLTLLRLTEGWFRVYVWFAIATLFIFAVPVAVIPWVLCKPIAKTFVDILPGKCVDKHPSVIYGRFQAVWAAIMDISMALLPWKVLWALQMRFAEKIGVGIAMSLGILAGATAIVRARYVEQLQEQDLSYEAYNSVIWSAAESAMTIVATSIPILRVFFKQRIKEAITSYQNSSSRSKSRTNASGSNPSQPSHNASAISRENKRRSKRNTTYMVEHTSTDSLFVDLESGSKEDHIELDDLVVDEKTGRVTALTPKSAESMPDSILPVHIRDERDEHWPLGMHPVSHGEGSTPKHCCCGRHIEAVSSSSSIP
ncbi:hypothetical protein PTT_04703 [Pyrenophora teres f. teres 0-1]|uniref:Rhodopsin domain-containing protein n=1 Tax=Pyrenophora teres f. teres (strain 0-1) TaxID=861557 RepID=E3REL7_PYRTT|nr:hypothetical protein PTT_04703 [Pyrenophora teres f. teres 0-1]